MGDSGNNVGFPLKTGSCSTAMVDLLFNAENPNYLRFVAFSGLKNISFQFYWQKRFKTGKGYKLSFKITES